MVPAPDLGTNQDPERHDRFEPAGPFNPADIQRPGPPEFLQDPDDLLLGCGVVPGDQHLRRAARVLRVDHLRVRDRVEALHDLRVRKEPLDSLAQGIFRADEQPRRRSAREVERIRDIDQNLGSEVLEPGEFDHVLGGRPLDREEQDLAVLRRLGERPRGRLAARLLPPSDDFRALRAARAELRLVAAACEPAYQWTLDLPAADHPNADAAASLEAVGGARRYGSKIMVDLMRVADKPARAKELEKLGVDYLNMHVSIDEQMLAHTPLQELKAVAAATALPVAVAGGLNSETVGQALKAGASIVIVGGAIIKAEDVAGATRTIKEAILQRKSIPTGLYKKYTDADVGEAFRKVSTPNLADAMQKRGVMTGLVPRIKHGTKLVGRAVTVKTADGDWAKPVEAIDRARAGDVIVIDVGGGPTAVWGELASNSCLVKGVAGVVIDGAVRDLDTILELNFPCFSRHVAPHAGEPKGLGEIGSEIECGGQKVHSGDWIVGDESGLIVVAREEAVEMANRALDVLERENRIREEIKRGGTLSSVLELEKWEQIR